MKAKLAHKCRLGRRTSKALWLIRYPLDVANCLSTLQTMHLKTQPPSASQPQTPASELDRALEINTRIEEVISQSASEMLLINTVLKQEIPAAVQTGDVQQALEQNGALEDKLAQTAEDLAQVNQALNEEIGHRAVLERELAEAKAALENAEDRPSKH